MTKKIISLSVATLATAGLVLSSVSTFAFGWGSPTYARFSNVDATVFGFSALALLAVAATAAIARFVKNN